MSTTLPGVSAVHKSPCQDALCSHARAGLQQNLAAMKNGGGTEQHSSHNSSPVTDGGTSIFPCAVYKKAPALPSRGPDYQVSLNERDGALVWIGPPPPQTATCIILQTRYSHSVNQD